MNSLQKLLEWLANLVELLGMAWPFLLQGAMYTVLFAAVSMVLGLILGFSVAVVRVTKVPVVSQIAAVYVSAFRGTPLLVQIFVLYYGLPSVGIEFTPVTAGILALTLNVAAYLSESMRGAILGIDKGQWEAGLSVGLTWGPDPVEHHHSAGPAPGGAEPVEQPDQPDQGHFADLRDHRDRADAGDQGGHRRDLPAAAALSRCRRDLLAAFGALRACAESPGETA
ncbi:amino acid ABC transporter permease [Pseudomonas aeruginosa]|nr:amino acid ABC transporter permease [Pseudomonas aeruginosa]